MRETPVTAGEAATDSLAEGRMDDAAAILGHVYAIRGEVVHGRKLGRTIGYPTANILLGSLQPPRFGVYATRTRLPDGRVLPGVANVGINPTTGVVSPRLEVWLFDFDEDLYGQILDTDLVAFLRPEAKFDSLEIMIEQIGRDVEEARALLG
jgi:riboflavin kinase/FMN adenylyltransferase